MSTSEALRSIFTAARPLVETWLDTAEQIAALRETATNAGLDWSQVKALLKAQIQDERDDAGDGKRVRKLIEKAEFACAYADMLGLGNMNEGNISADTPDWDDLRGIAPNATGDMSSEAFVRELRDSWGDRFHNEPAGPALPRPAQQAGAVIPHDHAAVPAAPTESDGGAFGAVKAQSRLPDAVGVEPPPSDEFPDLPEFLRRKKVAA